MKIIVFKVLTILTVVIMSISGVVCSTDSLDEANPISPKLTLEQAMAQQNTESTIANTCQMKKNIFSRSYGTGGFGHVGVGFELRSKINGVNYVSFFCGAIENYSASAYIQSGSTGKNCWWRQYSTQAEMLNRMQSLNYDKYKFGQKINPEIEASVNNGKAKLKGLPTRGYSPCI